MLKRREENGADPYGAAGFFGMSSDTLMSVYGHHLPDIKGSAIQALNRPSGVSVARLQKIPVIGLRPGS